MFKEKMNTESTPERVYWLCKNVEKYGPISVLDLKAKMEPDYLNSSKTNYFPSYRLAAEELKLIKMSDNMLSLAVEPDVLKTIESMRCYINGILEEFQTGNFYKVTREYYAQGSNILKGEQNLSNLTGPISAGIGSKIEVVEMRGWRFWAQFLGFGIRSQDMFIIPNAYQFLEDCIQNSKLEINRLYSMSDFISALRPAINIVVDPRDTTRTLNFGVSTGLRMLHDFGKIKMERIMDNEDGWSLYQMDAHIINSIATSVTILK